MPDDDGLKQPMLFSMISNSVFVKYTMGVRREGQGGIAPLKNQTFEIIRWKIQNEVNNINISEQFIQLQQVIRLGTGIGAIGDLFRNCQ